MINYVASKQIEKKIISELDELDSAPVECDGFVRLAAKVLSRAGQDFDVYVGSSKGINGGSIPLHYWIVWNDCIVDYRSRMWLGDGAQHGVLLMEAVEHLYDGDVQNVPLIPDFLEDLLKLNTPTFQ